MGGLQWRLGLDVGWAGVGVEGGGGGGGKVDRIVWGPRNYEVVFSFWAVGKVCLVEVWLSLWQKRQVSSTRQKVNGGLASVLPFELKTHTHTHDSPHCLFF